MSKLKLYQNIEFDRLRSIQDPLADQLVSLLILNPELITLINTWSEIPDKIEKSYPKEFQDFFNFYLTQDDIPEEVLVKGQKIFDKKGDLYLSMLGFYSLPYAYAFGDGAEVLVRSKRILSDIGRRLGETGSFILDIFEPRAFLTKKKAFLTCAKVRLIHAFSRYFISHYAPDWDDRFGKPINQEDLIGTNLSFSLIVIRGWKKMGFKVETAEVDVIMKYWKWIGRLMGIQETYWPENPKETFALEKLIRKRHLKSSDAGYQLIQALIGYYKRSIPDALISTQVEPILNFFLGNEVSKTLGIQSSVPVNGELLGLVFKFSGWKNYGANKGYLQIARQFQTNQKVLYGKELEIKLPELKRS
ncbi:oxygenase MpaB family protein [Algoriphagus sp. D3-2-R+10]|uniref:oxygenase MpaB family protein n=1 Tax=Algoriphagus aurantiacus TaxID=3103948 RepID=UPI002B3B709B|nr:oxygenase MpaB family protein [Algoriphagus sp. D3-2-R+10]MEB2775325.1 oxygenase MpaB family protein [Algoriphagus sp. D3-2-R+10]